MTGSTDPYLYPGTDVLKNLRDIHDPAILNRYEAESTTRRIVELIDSPMSGRFDATHLRAIHKHIFQDVYAWAGQFRTVNISKGGHPFGAALFIERTLTALLQKVSAEGYLQGTDPDSFVRRAGFFLSEINAVHPFREGNGRTQREFIRELGLLAGVVVDWTRITRDQMLLASRVSFETGDSAAIASLIGLSMR